MCMVTEAKKPQPMKKKILNIVTLPTLHFFKKLDSTMVRTPLRCAYKNRTLEVTTNTKIISMKLGLSLKSMVLKVQI